MTAEIISVGTEILLGNILNTNAKYLSEQLAALGINCYYQSVVGDNEGRIKEGLQNALHRSDLIILTGGLGPTSDDVTREAVSAALSKQLVEDEHTKDRIRDYFEKKGIDIAQNNWRQAMAPMGAVVVDNENGTAPGLIIEHGDNTVILLPGPPLELIAMFEGPIKRYLMKKGCGIIYSQTIKICGIAESAVDERIRDLTDNENPTIGTYAKHGEVWLRVTAKAEDAKAAKKLVKPVVKELKSRFGEDIFATSEEESLEKSVIDLMLENKLTMTTAESMTGGAVAARLINVPGASDAIRSGYIVYSNKAKRKVLGVKKQTIEKYGAVSEQTAKEMARGAQVVSKLDVVVAVTGEAGPETSEKVPVGRAYIACLVCGQMTVKEYNFVGDRNKIRMNATTQALLLMRKCILQYISQKAFGKEDK